MNPGQTFRNGVDGWHVNGAGWGEQLTVLRRDPTAIGCQRWAVADRNGRHMFALDRIAY